MSILELVGLMESTCPYTMWLADILLEEQTKKGIIYHYVNDVLVKGTDKNIKENKSCHRRICTTLGLKLNLFIDEKIKILEIYRQKRVGKSQVLD